MRAKVNAARHSALFDVARLCRNLERAYRTMWSRYESGAAPESFSLEDNA
jgi:predicted O-linked N-acetylglucosamine transferase (SPINDLY family)